MIVQNGKFRLDLSEPYGHGISAAQGDDLMIQAVPVAGVASSASVGVFLGIGNSVPFTVATQSAHSLDLTSGAILELDVSKRETAFVSVTTTEAGVSVDISWALARRSQ